MKSNNTTTMPKRNRLLLKAQTGDANAQYALGRHFCCKEPINKRKAVVWFRKAAEQGHVDGQYNLARAFEYGEGCKLDLAEAVQWYRKAALQGDADAQCSMGHVYFEGLGVNKDYPEAIRWYRKSAAQGCAPALYSLGEFYRDGEGVRKSTRWARYWFEKALAGDWKDAAKELALLDGREGSES